ncbi:hypothetical protein MRB53_010400 [Persea americana]|uniref:Uncharacterized protein n=1 Tax=Persea americana TaxID=3435 RepID=A0ACC2LSI1_PERAE|nr:hypothetical protein MRB53_010400 [Persea americana]
MGVKAIGYEYEIIYEPGKENSAADALSRMAGNPCLDALFVSQAKVWDNIKEEAISHPYMQKIGKLATENPGSPYTWRNGLEQIWKKDSVLHYLLLLFFVAGVILSSPTSRCLTSPLTGWLGSSIVQPAKTPSARFDSHQSCIPLIPLPRISLCLPFMLTSL